MCHGTNQAVMRFRLAQAIWQAWVQTTCVIGCLFLCTISVSQHDKLSGLFLQNAAMVSGDAAGSDAVSEGQHHSDTHPQEVLSKRMQWALLKMQAQTPPPSAVHQGKQHTQTLTGQAGLPCSFAGGHRGSPTPTHEAQEQSTAHDLRLQRQSRSPSPKRPRWVPSTERQISDPAPGPSAHGQAPQSPQQKNGSSPSQAGSRRSASPVSKAPRRLLPALPHEPLSTPANDARQLVSSHSQKGLGQRPPGHLPPSVRGNLAKALMNVHLLLKRASPSKFYRPLAPLPRKSPKWRFLSRLLRSPQRALLQPLQMPRRHVLPAHSG